MDRRRPPLVVNTLSSSARLLLHSPCSRAAQITEHEQNGTALKKPIRVRHVPTNPQADPGARQTDPDVKTVPFTVQGPLVGPVGVHGRTAHAPPRTPKKPSRTMTRSVVTMPPAK
jgi:hypothetical protein